MDPVPEPKVCLAAKAGVAAPGAVMFNSTETRVGTPVRAGQVGLAVAVEIAHRHRLWPVAGGKGLLGGKAGVAAPGSGRIQQHRDGVGTTLATGQVGLAIAVEIAHRHRLWISCPCQRSAVAAKVGAAAPGAVVFNSTETLLELTLALARSGRPSPLKSPTATEYGCCPCQRPAGGQSWRGRPGRGRIQQHRDGVGTTVGAGQVGLAIAIEIAHRHSKRPAARAKGLLGGKRGAAAPGAVVFNSTETVLELTLALARSSLPSPLKSPTATDRGPSPVPKACWGAKAGAAAPGAVVFTSTEMVSEPLLALARSGLPSPLKSPTATANGLLPVPKVRWPTPVMAGP